MQLVWSQTECGRDASISDSAQSHHLALQKSTQLHIILYARVLSTCICMYVGTVNLENFVVEIFS